eukprot:GHRR01035699.1.p1 GENE.GHRR01035699.1~~GHRR01035699.1.p1  ORF type:complete len:368 (+),score=115.57 GHRR01035699.1:577-1680(+)
MPCKDDPHTFVLMRQLGAEQSLSSQAVRLFQWIDYPAMGTAPQDSTLQRSWGCIMGHVTNALADFDHPAMHQHHDWNMMVAADIIQQRTAELEHFTEHQRHLVLSAAQQLMQHSQQLSASLPCQVCHADSNEANLLTDPARQQVTAIIDFGDACYCWRVAEVAIAMTYAALLAINNTSKYASREAVGSSSNQVQPKGRSSPDAVVAGISDSSMQHSSRTQLAPYWTAMTNVLEGYLSALVSPCNPKERHGQPSSAIPAAMIYMQHTGASSTAEAAIAPGSSSSCSSEVKATNTLTVAELQLLPSLIKARAALSLVNGAYTVRLNPGNAQYLLLTQSPGWQLLSELHDVSTELVLQRLGLRAACAALA